MFDRRWAKLEQREIRRRGRHIPTERPGQRPQPDLPEGTDLLPQIKHIVVLMMENHSYDNYLGTLTGRGDGLPEGDGGGQPPARRQPGHAAPPDQHRAGQGRPDAELARRAPAVEPGPERRVRAGSIEQLVPGHDPAAADGLLDRG